MSFIVIRQDGMDDWIPRSRIHGIRFVANKVYIFLEDGKAMYTIEKPEDIERLLRWLTQYPNDNPIFEIE